MTEYVDWRGRPVQVSAGDHRGGAGRDGRRHRRPGARAAAAGGRALAADAAADRGDGRRARPTWVPVHVTDGDPVEVWVELEDGSARRADQVDHWVEPREVDGAAGSARRRSRCRPTCRWATTGCGPAAATPRRAPTSSSRPRWLGLPRAGRQAAPVGVRHPALQRPLARQLGARRPHRPHRPGRLVGQRARRRLRPGQPAARRRAAGAAGAVALPAQLAPVLQPDLPARRADPGVRRPAGRTSGTRSTSSSASCRPG